MKKILAVIKNPVSDYPPFLSVIMMLASREGISLRIVCQSAPELLKGRRNIEITELKTVKPWDHLNRIQKIVYYLRFRKAVTAAYSEWSPDIFWIGTSDTAWILMGMRRLSNKVTHIIHNMELYDDDWVRYHLTRFASRRADKVVVCEINRAYFSKFMYGLDSLPVVLENRPIEMLLEPQVGDNRDVRLLREKLKGRFIVLYQGAIMLERVGFINVAKAVAELAEDWIFLCIGPDRMNVVEELKAKFGNYIYAGNHPAPSHLEYTVLANVGVASYTDNSFNTVYCAPNKIWEYTAFGVPVLCSRLPSLVMSVENQKAGLCVDMDDVSAIKDALRRIRENYTVYRADAKRFYINGGAEYDRVCRSF